MEQILRSFHRQLDASPYFAIRDDRVANELLLQEIGYLPYQLGLVHEISSVIIHQFTVVFLFIYLHIDAHQLQT